VLVVLLLLLTVVAVEVAHHLRVLVPRLMMVATRLVVQVVQVLPIPLLVVLLLMQVVEAVGGV
jgi:hypothetical protein